MSSQRSGGERVTSAAWLADGGATHTLLIARLGGQVVALPVGSVERILRMAALTPLPDAPKNVVGLLNFRGAILPVVDPRPSLNVPQVQVHPDQHMIVVSARSRYLLWVDRVESIVSVAARDVTDIHVEDRRSVATSVARLDGQLVPILAADSLDPGPIMQDALRNPTQHGTGV